MTVLDAYALVGYLRDEQAVADEVEPLIKNSAVAATVNLAETADRLVRLSGISPTGVRSAIAMLEREHGVRTVELTAPQAIAAGLLRAQHYHRTDRAVSIADCVAAATSLDRNEPLATSDPALAAVVREEGGQVIALPDSAGRRP